ncbi:hypothetical protein [Phaffia rhodozyma]|uniref:Zn(2)-C6 fungal-type DNA-binding domain n=1 Tax=Phaffia rhodozyma TaxID=264483 RepID=A0A0F7SPT6_PHARH|nr:hypothetical protein [Phaffia rhodozyma]
MSSFLALSPHLSSSSTPSTSATVYGQYLQPSLFSPGEHVSMSRVNQACTPCRTRCETAGKGDCIFEAVPFEVKVATRERKAKRRANVAKSSTPSYVCSRPDSPIETSTMSIRRRRDRADVALPISPRLHLYDNSFTFCKSSTRQSYEKSNQRRRRGALCSATVFQDDQTHASVPNTGLVYPIFESPYYSLIDSTWTSNVRSTTYPTPTSEQMYGLGLHAGREAYPIEVTGLATTLPHGQSMTTTAAAASGQYYAQPTSTQTQVPDGYFSIPIGHAHRSTGMNEHENRLAVPTEISKLSHHLLPALSLEDQSGEGETPGPPLTPQGETRLVHEATNGRIKAWVESGLYRDSIASGEDDQVEWSNAWCL